MKVLFLDIDGVLNNAGSHLYWEKKAKNENIAVIYKLCPIAVTNFNYLLEKCPDIKVIVHSSWRHSHTWKELKKILINENVNTKPFLGNLKKYKISSDACHDIDFFINDWNETYPKNKIEKYAIVDDKRNFRQEVMKNVFYTIGEDGLTYSVTSKIIEHFGGESDIFLL